MIKRIGKLFFGVMLLTLVAAISVFASEGETAVAVADAAAKLDASKWYAIAAAFALGIASFGGALAQGRSIQAALEGIARNPSAASKIQTPMIIGLALIESLVIYTFVVAMIITLKY